METVGESVLQGEEVLSGSPWSEKVNLYYSLHVFTHTHRSWTVCKQCVKYTDRTCCGCHFHSNSAGVWKTSLFRSHETFETSQLCMFLSFDSFGLKCGNNLNYFKSKVSKVAWRTELYIGLFTSNKSRIWICFGVIWIEEHLYTASTHQLYKFSFV